MPSYFYDIIIFGYLALTTSMLVVFAIQFYRYGKKVVNRWTMSIFLFLFVSAGVVFYGSFIEPQWIVVTRHEVKLGTKNTEQMSIVLVSDFHVGPYKQAAFVKKAVEKINAQQPDLIVLAGDFVFGDDLHPEYLDPLKELHAPLGKFAVLGNHEYTDGEEEDFPKTPYEGNERMQRVSAELKKDGLVLLRNASTTITKGAVSFSLGGTDEFFTGRADVKKAFTNAPAGLLKILAAHNPDIIKQATRNNVDLVLAGHTHAGQIRLPFIGPLARIPTRLGRKYDQGMFEFPRSDGGKTALAITRGIGESGTRARLFAPPEIFLLTISF